MPNVPTTHSRPSAITLLASGTPEEISAELARRVRPEHLARGLRDLLKNYWQPDEAPEEQARHVGKMVEDLEHFPEAVLVWALREWRLGQTRRPSTADLYQLATKREAALRARLAAAAPEPDQSLASLAEVVDRAKRAETLSRIMNEVGFRMRPVAIDGETEGRIGREGE